MYSTASAPCDMPISVIHCSACTRRTVPTLCAMFYLSETTWTARLIIPTDTFELTLKYIPIPFVKRQVFVDVGSPLEMAASIVIKAHTANHLELIEQVRTMSLDSGYNHSTRADMFVRRFIAGGEQGLPAFVARHAYTRIWSQPFHWFASFFSHTHTLHFHPTTSTTMDMRLGGWMRALYPQVHTVPIYGSCIPPKMSSDMKRSSQRSRVPMLQKTAPSGPMLGATFVGQRTFRADGAIAPLLSDHGSGATPGLISASTQSLLSPSPSRGNLAVTMTSSRSCHQLGTLESADIARLRSSTSSSALLSRKMPSASGPRRGGGAMR